jgi:hypothetical protein
MLKYAYLLADDDVSQICHVQPYCIRVVDAQDLISNANATSAVGAAARHHL